MGCVGVIGLACWVVGFCGLCVDYYARFVCLLVCCLLFAWMFVVYSFADCCFYVLLLAGFGLVFLGFAWFG